MSLLNASFAVLVAQDLLLNPPDRCLVSLKIYSAHCFSAAEREAHAVKSSATSPNTVWSKHILPCLYSTTSPSRAQTVLTRFTLRMSSCRPYICSATLSARKEISSSAWYEDSRTYTDVVSSMAVGSPLEGAI